MARRAQPTGEPLRPVRPGHHGHLRTARPRPGPTLPGHGPGTGSVARMFAEWVGSQGEVLAVDADTRFLEQLADDTITVLSSDVTVEPLPQGRLVLVHARLLLEHLPASEAVLRAMRARPGRAARSWWRTWTGPPRSP
ncbi:class I SAM-dependent methyltransferase [Streptomyces sp. NPDC047515]|uniref:class I SAM-dependent methyltransferase n=1 Tax=Streptomyces sp. NPDC047515 TaxID=3155380 RepID=UPI0033C9341C